ncbi:MAG: IPExxxVDY family protein [Bacteroidales bacterium]|nr:IPExxxVDY family protein [Bacteroidales bacterium]
MKQKKIHQLDGSHEPPFALIAISCHESLLKTVWNINKQLNICLSKSDVSIESKEDPSLTFPVFCDRKSSSVRIFNFISNKSSNLLLIKELPNIDFIFEISGEINKTDISFLIKEIKRISGVNAALELNPEKIKRRVAFCPI